MHEQLHCVEVSMMCMLARCSPHGMHLCGHTSGVAPLLQLLLGTSRLTDALIAVDDAEKRLVLHVCACL